MLGRVAVGLWGHRKCRESSEEKVQMMLRYLTRDGGSRDVKSKPFNPLRFSSARGRLGIRTQ